MPPGARHHGGGTQRTGPDALGHASHPGGRCTSQQPGHAARWIENSQGTKPGNLMPNQNLAGEQLTDVIAYLETLH